MVFTAKITIRLKLLKMHAQCQLLLPQLQLLMVATQPLTSKLSLQRMLILMFVVQRVAMNVLVLMRTNIVKTEHLKPPSAVLTPRVHSEQQKIVLTLQLQANIWFIARIRKLTVSQQNAYLALQLDLSAIIASFLTPTIRTLTAQELRALLLIHTHTLST